MSSSLKFCAYVVLAIGLLAGMNSEVRAAYSRKTPISEAYSKTKDAVVTLRVTRGGAWGGDGAASGSGVIVDERGYVITNHHVIANAGKITATLSDETTLEARIIADEPRYDLAILRLVVKKELKALSFGPGTDLMVGETVIAIGNPFGEYKNSVSTGIISALGREVEMSASTTLKNVIQTNASINPGNSGGPLLNINGELIGINVALRSDAQGIAFAIDAETAKEVLRKHLSADKVSKVGHGLTCREKVAPEGESRQSVVVEQVSNEQADVRKGDELVKVGQLAVKNRFDVERALWGHKPGTKIEAMVRRDGKLTTAYLTLTGAEPKRVTQASNKGR
jgi:serine protease Do